MAHIFKIIGAMSLCSCLFVVPTTYVQANSKTQHVTASQNDAKKLIDLWLNYQQRLLEMEKAAASIKTEIDDNQRNAKIALYTRQLEESKNLLNRLVLTQLSANQLRQQMLEHATKYQNVFKLATTPKPNPNQLNSYERLSAQTDALFMQMQNTALSVMK